VVSVYTIGKVSNMRRLSYKRLLRKHIREVLTSHAHVPKSLYYKEELALCSTVGLYLVWGAYCR
jgi:hypothetical protein